MYFAQPGRKQLFSEINLNKLVKNEKLCNILIFPFILMRTILEIEMITIFKHWIVCCLIGLCFAHYGSLQLTEAFFCTHSAGLWHWIAVTSAYRKILDQFMLKNNLECLSNIDPMTRWMKCLVIIESTIFALVVWDIIRWLNQQVI